MSKFYVTDTFELPRRQLFALAGSILEGEIHPGMLVSVMFNPAVQIMARIHSIEIPPDSKGSEDVCLCLETEPKMLKIWRALPIKHETLEVKADLSQKPRSTTLKHKRKPLRPSDPVRPFNRPRHDR